LGRPKKDPPFWRRVAYILIFLVQSHAPPPVEEDIIITTTIIIVAREVKILYVLFFSMKDVCFINIQPAFQKKNYASNFILGPLSDFPERGSHHRTAPIFNYLYLASKSSPFEGRSSFRKI